MIDLTLYLVTARGDMPLEKFFKIILEAVNGGVTAIQLREKYASNFEMLKIAKELLRLLRPRRIPLIINDRIEVALEAGADGVHLGQSDHTSKQARALLGQHAIIGLSVETLDQAKKALAEDVEYIAVSPVFTTSSKMDCASPSGVDGLKEICLISHLPVVGIGGINSENMNAVFQAGASGIAVVSSIFHAACPKQAASLLRR